LDDKLRPPNNRTDLANVPTLKDIFVDSLKFAKPVNGAESIKMNRLSEKIFDAIGEVQIEDAEFELLKIKVNENGPGYFVWAHAQAMESLIGFDING